MTTVANNTMAAAAPPKITAAKVHTEAQDFVSTNLAWFHSHWLQILIAVGVGVAIFLALHTVKGLGNRLCKRDKSGTGWGAIFGRAIVKTGNFFIAMTAAELVAGYAHAPQPLMTTINFLFTVAAVFQAAVWAREIILGAIEHRTTAADHHGEALTNAMGLIRLFVTFVLFAIALVLILGNLGVNVTGLIAGLGVGGIAIGLAAQSIFADLFAAITIIFDRPFKRGDAITFDKSSGTIEYIGMRSTRIRGTAGEARIIGNKKLLDQEIINNTQREYRRVIFTLGVVQTTAVDVLEVLPHMMKEEIEAHGAHFVRAGFSAFGAQSYDFDVEFDSPGAAFQDMYDARHSVGLAIIRRLNDESIVLAYPTQTSISAEEAGMIQPKRRKRGDGDDDPNIAAPPSSGDRTSSDQESS